MFDSLGLYDYELRDVRAIADAFHRVRRVVYTLPTGGGKTHVAVAHIIAARRRGERVLFLAHRRELVNQAAKRLARAGVPESDIGVIMAGDRRACALSPAQVASVDTVRRRNKPDADFIIVDECHRVMSPTYRSLLALYPNAKVLGLTATPFRLDGRGLRAEFDEIVVGCSPQELIEHGQLVTSRVFTVPDELLPVLKDVRIVAGDYNQGQLGKVMNRRPLVASIVQEYKRLGEDRAAVVFSSGREHARVIQAEFAEAGYAAEYLDGDTPVADRDAMLARLRDGATRVLVNCDVLVEGWDAPWVKCVILARPTRSLGRYLQMVGRVLRRYRGETALVLDHAGNAVMHGTPDMDRRAEFTLDDRARRNGGGNGKPLGKRCPECGLTVAAGTRTCSECGYEWPVDSVPDTITGELVGVQRGKCCLGCGKQLASSNYNKRRTGMCSRCLGLANSPERRRSCAKCGAKLSAGTSGGVCIKCIRQERLPSRHCSVCGVEISKYVLQNRSGKCRRCSSRESIAVARQFRDPEERRATARRVLGESNKKRSTESRSVAARRGHAAMLASTRNERSAKIAAAALSNREALAERAKKNLGTRYMDSLSHEQRSELVKKAWATRRATAAKKAEQVEVDCAACPREDTVTATIGDGTMKEPLPLDCEASA